MIKKDEEDGHEQILGTTSSKRKSTSLRESMEQPTSMAVMATLRTHGCCSVRFVLHFTLVITEDRITRSHLC